MAGKKITLEEARVYIKNHKESKLNTDKKLNSLLIDVECLKDIIAQDGCVSVRFFKAKTKVSTSSLDGTLVAVGVDANGNNITTIKAADGTMVDAALYQEFDVCPPNCGSGDQGDNL